MQIEFGFIQEKRQKNAGWLFFSFFFPSNNAQLARNLSQKSHLLGVSMSSLTSL